MQQSRSMTLISILSFGGFLVSLYQVYHFFQIRNGLLGFSTFCDINSRFSCSTIDLSPYAELVPGFPLSAFAAGWLLAQSIIAFVGRNPYWKREASRILFGMTGWSLLCSFFYLFVMASVLNTFCMLCLIIDGINVLNFLLILSVKPELSKKSPWDKTQLKPLVTTAVICVAVIALASKIVDPKRMTNEQIDRIVRQVLRESPVPVDSQSPATTMGEGPITIVKFGDFQCPSCRRGAEWVHTILKQYPHQVTYIYKSFPLDSSCNPEIQSAMHPAACEAARAAFCASKQGRFKETYETIFEHQTQLEPGRVVELIREKTPGVDTAALLSCMDSEEAQLAVKKDIDEGVKLGVQSTPTFFINGHKVLGALPPQAWSKLVTHFLADAH